MLNTQTKFKYLNNSTNISTNNRKLNPLKLDKLESILNNFPNKEDLLRHQKNQRIDDEYNINVKQRDLLSNTINNKKKFRKKISDNTTPILTPKIPIKNLSDNLNSMQIINTNTNNQIKIPKIIKNESAINSSKN